VSARRARVPADAAQLPVLVRLLGEFCSATELASAQQTAFELALEEIFTNIVKHGVRPDRVPWVEVSLDAAADGLTMVFEDDGPAFDPLSLPTPDVNAGLDERPVGGLGVFLVQQMMDAVTYQRVGTRNRLTLTKYPAC
jgi:serine/threonine-protein kinase RsbW